MSATLFVKEIFHELVWWVYKVWKALGHLGCESILAHTPIPTLNRIFHHDMSIINWMVRHVVPCPQTSVRSAHCRVFSPVMIPKANVSSLDESLRSSVILVAGDLESAVETYCTVVRVSLQSLNTTLNTLL